MKICIINETDDKLLCLVNQIYLNLFFHQIETFDGHEIVRTKLKFKLNFSSTYQKKIYIYMSSNTVSVTSSLFLKIKHVFLN